MKKITKVYTRSGDEGMTSLVGGQRVSKASVRLESYGTIDELSSHLGLLAALLPDGEDKEMIFRIQNNLFNVCTNLATDQEQTPLYPSAHLPEGAIASLEQEVSWRYSGSSSGSCVSHGVPTSRTADCRTCSDSKNFS